MGPLLFVPAPLLITCILLVIWKLFYVGRRPLSRGVKIIVIVLLIWFSLPIIMWLYIMGLAAGGGHMGS